jgi:hypothetical protein
MVALRRPLKRSLMVAGAMLAAALTLWAFENIELPPMGRDTVLVWKAQSPDFETNFIARIAIFTPNRFLEWEDGKTQGTVSMTQQDIQEAPGYDSSNLFVSGVDKRSANTTTLWLSRKIFRMLKEKKRAKCILDGVSSKLTYLGDATIQVDVNRSERELPVIMVSDDRGSERWFLNSEDNPLLMRHQIRNYDQKLTSITTDRPNTLRWIKGKKLANASN